MGMAMNGDKFIPGAGGQTASAAGLPPNAARKRGRTKWIRTKYGRMAVPYEVWAGIWR